ncbi:hypothetical protein ABET51_14875 [Metabacillus fastidiosus]|uniref:hypothetical protein n=1 Tax=Metabacillus fastidiosus TaxID=1458 RepID=UPI002E1F1E80|nr:hypothetical protein [Metabacillus fastidiosus]
MNKNEFSKDIHHEGRDKAFLDIDRMINEGLSGGSVHGRGEITNIEEARDLVKEDPPSVTNEKEAE